MNNLPIYVALYTIWILTGILFQMESYPLWAYPAAMIVWIFFALFAWATARLIDIEGNEGEPNVFGE